MLNPRLAGRYAKSLTDLAIEKGQLEGMYKDIQHLKALTGSSRELVAMLKSPVIPSDKKEHVMEALIKGKVSDMTWLFVKLLIRKGREGVLPEIIRAAEEQYKRYNKIHVVSLTTASPISDDLKQTIISKLKAETPYQNIEIETIVNPDIIGGFVLEVENSLIDASISYDLNAIKKQFENNDFIYKIR